MGLWICLRKVFLLLEKSGVALILRFDNIRKSEQGTPPRPEEAAAQNILPTSQKWAVTEPTIQQMQPMPSAETQENRVRPAPTTLSAELTYFFITNLIILADNLPNAQEWNMRTHRKSLYMFTCFTNNLQESNTCQYF